MNNRIASPIYTPVRRRQSTINTRQHKGEQEKEWTVARCQRLLRALTSRVAILKKELSLIPGASQPNNEGAQKRPTAAHDDADWTRAHKKIRKTYSSKGAKKDHGQPASRGSQNGISGQRRKPPIPGEVSVPTPFLARARGETPGLEESRDPSTAKPAGEEISGSKRAGVQLTSMDPQSRLQMSDTLRYIRKRVPASCYAVYEGLHHGLEALLRATSESEPDVKQIKPRSLMAMALRAIPQYIVQQESLLQAHIEETKSKSAIANRDMSTEIYDELESFGTGGSGWKHLRIVVRSHGIEVICDAIRTGLLDVEFCGILVTLCLNTGAIEEAKTIISTLLLSTSFSRPRTLYDAPNRSLSILWRFTEHTGQVSFQYRTLSNLVSQGLLHVEWLATKGFGPFWTGIIQSLAPGNINQDALVFLDISLPLLSTNSQANDSRSTAVSSIVILEATRNTFSSLLTTLASIVILSKGSAIATFLTEARRDPKGFEHISTLLRGCLLEHKRLAETSNIEGALLLLTNLILHTEDEEFLRSGVEQLTDQLLQKRMDPSSRSDFHNEVVMFICRVACCCGRGASSLGFEDLQYLHSLLEGFPCSEESQYFLRGLIVDSAFVFSKMVPDTEHHDYAATLDANFCTKSFNIEVSLQLIDENNENEAQHGFRWEEGIGEWVAATPALNRHESKGFEARIPADDSEQDTPYRSPFNLRRKKQAEDIECQTTDRKAERNISKHSQLLEASPIASDSLIEQQDTPTTSSGEESPKSQFHSPASDDELSGQSEDTTPASQDRNPESELSFSEGGSLILSPLTMSTGYTGRESRHNISRAPRVSRKLFSKGQDWPIFDDSLMSTSSISESGSESVADRRRYVDRAPRLGRRTLHSNQTWQLFDESDDELSLLSTSSQDDSVLNDITKSSTTNVARTRSRRTKPLVTRSKAMTKVVLVSNDSEDELCI